MPPLRSDDATQALVPGRLAGDEDRIRATVEELSPAYTRTDGPIEVGVGGQAEVFRQVGTQVEEDLQRSETIAFPIVLLLLILVFGSAVAAGLPLLRRAGRGVRSGAAISPGSPTSRCSR